ncbi:MAG: TonB family protein [Flammeovirgaceae bacterium]|nr:MAG: TonB family protein [Flammeovirgaceae bacterium]
MTDYTNDIKRYLNGEMTPAEMQALEKKALSDPFLAEALEGALHVSVTDFSNDVAELNSAIDKQSDFNRKATAASKVAAQPVPAEELPAQKTTSLPWVFRIAAALLLLAVATFTIWYFAKQDDEVTLALNKAETESSSVVAGDKDTHSAAIAESATPSEQAGPVKRDEPGTGANYPAEVKAKPSARSTEDKTFTAKTDEKPATEIHGVPALAETEKAKEQTEQVPATEKVAELAVADKQEEQLQKPDLPADERKKVSGVTRSSVLPERYIMQGKVTSKEDGSPLPGINVVIKGTSIGTVTDATGNFQIESAQPNPSLVFSFIGLQTQEVAVADRNQVDVQMALDVTQLSEVVVTGYGIQGEAYTPTVELAHPGIGNRAFKQYLEKNLQYPREALDKKVEGRVTIEFFVETNGALSGFTVIRGIGAGCDEEVIRLVREGPKWEPTRRDGVPVRDKARVRLKFDLPKK